MKKIGWTLTAFLPMLLYFVLQIAGVMAGSVVITLIVFAQQIGTGMELEELTALAIQKTEENTIPLMIAVQILALIVFGLWYYFVWGKKKRPAEAPRPQAVHLVLIVILGVLVQFAVSGVLSLISMFAPQLLESYMELMEQAGILEVSVLTLISTVILAPLSEELACRGVILKLAGKVSPRFWVANIIQAAAFGILHANIVQGLYAFALGLVLGLIYQRFSNIWLCMLLHASMNFSSILVDPFYELFPESQMLPVVLITLLISAALFVLCFRTVMTGEKDELRPAA